MAPPPRQVCGAGERQSIRVGSGCGTHPAVSPLGRGGALRAWGRQGAEPNGPPWEEPSAHSPTPGFLLALGSAAAPSTGHQGHKGRWDLHPLTGNCASSRPETHGLYSILCRGELAPGPQRLPRTPLSEAVSKVARCLLEDAAPQSLAPAHLAGPGTQTPAPVPGVVS